jgi:peptidoglycan-associated lipoprotein
MTGFKLLSWLWPTTPPRRVSGLFERLPQLLLATALVALLSGCPSKTPVAQTPPPAPPPPAPTAAIEVTPATVQQGQPVTITWKTENGSDVAIEQIGAVQPNGSETLTLAESATYHQIAKGPGGVEESDARVTVVPAAAADATPMGDESAPTEANRLDVFVDLDDFSIRPDQVPTVMNDAQFLKDHPEMRMVVEGHCDELRSTEYNLALGDKRAAEVKIALQEAGINASRIRAVSYGKELPVCAEQSESCWRLNRRAHITPDVQR